MRRWIVALAAVAPFAAVGAQTLEVGNRIRLTVYEAQRQWDAPARRLILRGEVTRIVSDSIYLRPASLTSELSIPITAIKSLQRSRGISRPASAARNALVGAAVTALYASVFQYDIRYLYGASNRRDAVLGGAAVGAAAGIVMGLAFPTESWQRLKNWNR